MEKRINAVLEEIRPKLARHGGGVELVDCNASKGIVKLRLKGGCAGCAMANVTLRAGIEGMIRKAVPEVTEIIDVTDHKVAEDAYYKLEA